MDEGATWYGLYPVHNQCALELRTETVPGRVPARVHVFHHAKHHPRASGHRDHACVGLLLHGLDALAQEQAYNVALGKRLDALTRIEHDDAVARSHEITFEDRAIRELERIRPQGARDPKRQRRRQKHYDLFH